MIGLEDCIAMCGLEPDEVAAICEHEHIGAVPAAYSLTRLAGRWGEGLGMLIFLVYLVPPTLLFIPLSRVVADLGLRNTWWAMVLVYPSFTIPFCTWLLMGFFKSIPKDESVFDILSEQEEVVVDTDVRQPQHLSEQLAQLAFARGARAAMSSGGNHGSG